MYGYMAGWAWLWMSVIMIFWLVVLGAVIYLAVRTQTGPDRVSPSRHAPSNGGRRGRGALRSQ
jgi:predicted secreted protein